jgi:hypothetical protein
VPRSVALPVETIRAAEFVFFGTVRRLQASNVAQVEPEDDVAIVRADDVIISPHSVGEVARRDLTVRLSRKAKAGDKGLILGSTWIIGDEIAIIELDRLTGRLDRVGIRESVLDERLRFLDERLVERVARADVVVRGRVQSVSTVAVPPKQQRRGVAWWHVASIEVLDVLKGHPDATARVAFLDPRPPRWHDAPMLAVGQEGVWILRTAARTPEWRDLPAVPKNVYSALDPLDYQSSASFERMYALLRLNPQASRVKK